MTHPSRASHDKNIETFCFPFTFALVCPAFPSLVRCVLQDAIREAGGHVAVVEVLMMHQGYPGVVQQACAVLAYLAWTAANQVTSTGTRECLWGDGVCGCRRGG